MHSVCVGSHTYFKNSINNLVLKNIKYSMFFSSFGVFSEVFPLCFWRYDEQNTLTIWHILRVELQALAKLSFYLSVSIVSTVYNSMNQRSKSTTLLPTTQVMGVGGWGMGNHLFKSHCHN